MNSEYWENRFFSSDEKIEDLERQLEEQKILRDFYTAKIDEITRKEIIEQGKNNE